MNRSEFILKLADRLNISKQSSKATVDVVLDLFKESIVDTGELKLSDFGVFKLKTTSVRKGRNMLTGEERQIPQRKTIKFKLSKNVKESLNA